MEMFETHVTANFKAMDHSTCAEENSPKGKWKMKPTASAGTKQSQFGRFSFSFAIWKKCKMLGFGKLLRISLTLLIAASAINCQGAKLFRNRREMTEFK